WGVAGVGRVEAEEKPIVMWWDFSSVHYRRVHVKVRPRPSRTRPDQAAKGTGHNGFFSGRSRCGGRLRREDRGGTHGLVLRLCAGEVASWSIGARRSCDAL